MSVSGVVLSAQESLPIAGARIFSVPLGPNGAMSRQSATSDETGRFILDLEPGTAVNQAGVRLAATREGYVPVVVETTPPRDDIEFRLERGAAISGRLTGADGEGIAGHRIVAHARSHLFGWPHDEGMLSTISSRAGNMARSGEDGSFQILGLVPGETYTVYAVLDGYVKTTAHWPVVMAPADGVELVLQAVATTRLRVIDETTREPVSAYAISAVRDEHLAATVGSSSHGRSALDVQWVAPSAGAGGSDGKLTAAFEVSALGYATRVVEGRAVIGQVDDMVIELTPEPGHRYVRFRVEDERGVGIRGRLRVVIGDPAFAQFLALDCDTSGISQRLLAPEGRTQVLVTGGGVSTLWYKLPQKTFLTIPQVATEPTEVVVPLVLPGQQFEIGVFTQEGEPCRGYGLSIVPLGSPPLGANVPDWDLPTNAYFQATGLPWSVADPATVLLPPGEWTVTANRVGLGLGSMDVTAHSSGQPGTIRIVLDPRREWRPDQWVKRHGRR